MEISRLFASFGVRVNRAELRKVDMALATMESKIRAWNKRQRRMGPMLRLSNFDVDDARLRLVLGNALDRASRRITFEISRFAVRPGAIQGAVNRAARAGVVAPVAGAGVEGAAGRPRSSPAGRATAFHTALGTGVGALGMRPYGPLAAGGVAGYMGFRGLASINQRNQEILSARIATRAVTTMFGGTDKEGNQSFDWLRKQGQRLGFSYMDASQGYNSFMANALGAGMGTGGAQDVFKGFTEFSKVQGVPKAKMKLVNQALGQMMG